jgi:hypothetical protein
METIRIVSEKPDKWVILKITHNGNTFYKVFGSWGGGYLTGDSWRMNSGISNVEEDEGYFYFYGYSGSCYQCKKGSYGFATSYSAGIVDSLKVTADKNLGEIDVLDESTDWLNLLK